LCSGELPCLPTSRRENEHAVGAHAWSTISAIPYLFKREQRSNKQPSYTLSWLPPALFESISIMIESDHVEERLARVERILLQCRREGKNPSSKAVAASKVVVIVSATPLGSTHRIQPIKPKQSTEHTR